MIRSIAIWALGLINTASWTLVAVIYTIFSASSRNIHFTCAVPWSKLILWISGVRVEIMGLNQIQEHTPYIYIPNHSSFFDIFSLLAYLPVEFKFILKEELMRIPFLSWGMRKAGYISISRASPAKARSTFKQAVTMIRNGTSLVIFAEGTRSYDGHLQPLKRGAFQLAMASGTSIVPVAIKGSHKIMTRGNFKLNKGTIKIQLGKPIVTQDYKRKQMPELIGRVTESLEAMLDKL